MFKFAKYPALAAFIAGLTVAGASPALAGQKLSNDLSRCTAGSPSAVYIAIRDVKSSSGTLRVQLYRGTKSEWLKTGKWLNRIEVPAKAGQVMVCMPTPGPGSYGIAIRHDVNGNGDTDIFSDGGGMSNNPSINIFNLGKPSYEKTRFKVGGEVKSIAIDMRYM